MGVPEHPLQQRGDDAGGRPALPHHHCHDTGTQGSKCASLSPVNDALCDSVSLSLQVNRIVAMKLCDIGMFTVHILIIFNFHMVPNVKEMLVH